MGACQQAASNFADPATACAVCLAESGGDPNASNGADFGLFQIEASAHPDFDMSRWSDPTYNAQYAAQLQASSGWRPWTTYTSGKYQQYLGQCSASAQPAASGSPDTGGSAITVYAGLGLGALLLVMVLESL